MTRISRRLLCASAAFLPFAARAETSDPKLAETRAKYLQHLTNVLTLAGEQNAPARAQAILDLETRIATAHWPRAESRDANKTYNNSTSATLDARLTPDGVLTASVSL